MRSATYYLTLSFGKGMLDEIETEVHYYFTPGEPGHQPAQVELVKVMHGSRDIRQMLPEALERKVEADILTNELRGVFA
jgi:hypothetical protein